MKTNRLLMIVTAFLAILGLMVAVGCKKSEKPAAPAAGTTQPAPAPAPAHR